MTEPLSRQALAVLRSADRRTAWMVVLVATVDPADRPDQARLESLHRALPLIGARVAADRWVPGPAPVLLDVGDRDPVADGRVAAPIDLAHGAPLRVVVGGGGRLVAVGGHHAAFDGRALAALLAALLGGDVPSLATAPAPAGAARVTPSLRRLLRPADRVAASANLPPHESYVSRELTIAGPNVTARLASACADAARAWNETRGAPWRRVGVSVAVGGPSGVGNVASYRRVDVDGGQSVHDAVLAALADPREPAELAAPPRFLRVLAPLATRFSDSFLVSNLGRVEMPHAHSLEFFPVARGRSAIAFGAATVGDTSRLALRARDLDEADAASLLDAVVARWR